MNSLVPGTVPTAAPVTAAQHTTAAMIAAEEQALRAAQAAVAAGTPAGIDDATFADAWRHILGTGQGQPALGYPAASVYARLCNTTIAPGGGYAGAGALGQVTAHEPMHVLQIAGDMGWRKVTPVAPPPPAMPAAPLAPTFTSAPVMNAAPPAMSAPIQPVPSILAPDAPQSNPALAMVQPVVQMSNVAPPEGHAARAQAHIAAEIVAAAEQPKRRGRPRKNADPNASTTMPAASQTGSSTVAENVAIDGYPLEVFADCYPADGGADTLEDYITRTLDVLVKRFCPPPSIPDIRAAANDTPIGFGKWRAAIAVTAREVPPPPGRYTIRTGGDEIRDEFANALRSVCLSTGGLFVDGRR